MKGVFMESMSRENRSILKVAYTLATLNGEISSAKLEAFKQFCFVDNAFLPGTEETNSLQECSRERKERLSRKLTKWCV